MEVIENIDLNKLLDELRKKSKQLKQYWGIEETAQQKVEEVYKIGQQQVRDMERKFQREKSIKEQAFSRLDALWLEIRAIEG